MDAAVTAFLEKHHSAVMTTLRADGTPHSVRVGVALVDGKVWSSGTQDRVRTAHLRRDPRSTLTVFDNAWAYLTMECRVRILDGPEMPQQNLRLFQVMQAGMTPGPSEGKIVWYGQERTFEEFLRLMVEEQRLVYEFEPVQVYGLYGEATGR